MKIEKYSDLVQAFEEENDDLPQVSESGVIIHIIEIKEQLRVMIDLTDDTTNQELRDAIPLALEWRDRVIKFQGLTWLWNDNSFINSILDYIDESPSKRIASYSQIAECLNDLISDWMYDYTRTPKVAHDKNIICRNFILFDLEGIEKRIPNPLLRIRRILSVLHLRDNEINEILKIAIEMVNHGQSPFDSNYPISKERILQLRRWRDNKLNIRGLSKPGRI